MSRVPTGRLLTAVLLGVAVLLAGCSSSADEEVVTVTQQVPGPGGQTPGSPAPEEPTDPPSDPPSDTAPTDGEPSDTEPSDTASDEGSTTQRSSTAPPAGSTRSSSRSSVPRPSAPASNAADVGREVPGPERGRKCATNAEYWDEDPTGLRSDVITGWRSIEKAANAEGVIVCLNDGKRSTAQQQAQYDEYVAQYGAEVADQLVLPPEKSAHVTGIAIDVQPQAAYQWLQATKGSLGFCRIYDNEPWHFEYDVGFFTGGCPARLPKPER